MNVFSSNDNDKSLEKSQEIKGNKDNNTNNENNKNESNENNNKNNNSITKELKIKDIKINL